MREAIQIGILLALAGVSSLDASTFSFSTPSGAKDVNASNPLDASALFVISSNGGTNNVLTITLTNLQNNPAEDGQVLDALTLQLQNQNFNAGTTIGVSASLSEAFTVNSSNGAYTPASTCKPGNNSGCSAYTSNWKTTATVTGTTAAFDLCDAQISSIGCTSSFSAADGIVGGPDPHSGVYDNTHSGGNPTIPSNPYIFETMTFTATATNGSFTLPSNYGTDITSLEFGFGQDGTDVTSETGVTPEPSSIALAGFALVACSLTLWYRRRRAAARVA